MRAMLTNENRRATLFVLPSLTVARNSESDIRSPDLKRRTRRKEMTGNNQSTLKTVERIKETMSLSKAV